jgi:hypothetical protein
MFVKWGQTVAGIFKSVVGIVSDVIDIGRKLTENFVILFNRIFGTSVKDLGELLNLLTVKFVAALTFLSVMIEPLLSKLSPLIDFFQVAIKGALEIAGAAFRGFLPHIMPIVDNFMKIVDSITTFISNLTKANEMGHSIQGVFQTLGDLLGGIVEKFLEFGGSFLDGFLSSLSQVATPLQGIADSFKRIWDALVGGERASRTWNVLFRTLGELVGTAVLTTLETIAGLLTAIADTVEFLTTGKTPGYIENANPEDIKEDMLNRSLKRWGVVEDAIITKDGKVIKTNPDDNIIATKTRIEPGLPETKTGIGGKVINLDFSGMQLIMQGATREETERVGNDLVGIIRNALSGEFEREGY